MSETKPSWFHCGRCGELFQAERGHDENRLCTKCGFNPSTGTPSGDLPAPKPAPVRSHNHSSDKRPDTPRKRSSKKRKRGSHFIFKLVTGWTILLALIVIGAKALWSDEQASFGDEVMESEMAERVNREDDQRQLNEALPECGRTFASFLAAGSQEQRSQFVLTPVTTTSRMVRFYSQNPIININPKSLSVTGQSMIRLPDGQKSLLARWRTDDDRTIEACFRKLDDEWRLDWEHYVRYSDYPWALFLAGSGPSEGEFRLLARERLPEERKNAPTISLVLYAPRFGKPTEPGFQSPEFLVSRNHRNGKLLDAAFRQMREQKSAFGSTLPNINPDGMIRVRVKVRRIQDELQRSFEITDVIACHWMSVDDPGVTLGEENSETTDTQDL